MRPYVVTEATIVVTLKMAPKLETWILVMGINAVPIPQLQVIVTSYTRKITW